jgi:photosystem II core protein PsbZ|uniref:Photosystem II reaction center protein Z n=1 Tax=Attheya longicornis TaxID=451786 RepID=A0A2U9NPS8_9STRA|nr:photosystem II protein Z [Attheya longicornis]AWT39082.1 photosystem II protein Z [Attheya longicornis]
MITALVALLVLLSLGLVVTVPVALATPGEWEDSKDNFSNLFNAWLGLVIIIAIADGVASSV